MFTVKSRFIYNYNYNLKVEANLSHPHDQDPKQMNHQYFQLWSLPY